MSAELAKIIRDWSVVAGAVFVAAPLASSLARRLRTPSGLADASPLTSEGFGAGLLVGVLVLVIAIGYGIFVGRIAHVRLALICTGLALTMPAWRFGTVHDLVRDSGGSDVLSKLAVEGAIFGALAVLGCVLMLRLSKPVPEATTFESPRVQDWLIAPISALVCGAGAAWLVARSPLQGQAFAAAVAAGVAGGAIARSASFRAPMISILAGGLGLACLGPVVAGTRIGPDALSALHAGIWPALGYITPFDWIAGVLIGAPLGEMWAHSMVDRQVSSESKVKLKPAQVR